MIDQSTAKLITDAIAAINSSLPEGLDAWVVIAKEDPTFPRYEVITDINDGNEYRDWLKDFERGDRPTLETAKAIADSGRSVPFFEQLLDDESFHQRYVFDPRTISAESVWGELSPVEQSQVIDRLIQEGGDRTHD